jgi:hypothetical protein
MMVTEWAFGGNFSSGANQPRSFPHPHSSEIDMRLNRKRSRRTVIETWHRFVSERRPLSNPHIRRI